MDVPHPVPYQGSKRLLAPRILAVVGPRKFDRLFEPFAGSAAISLAAADRGLARTFHLNDLSRPVADLWTKVLGDAAEVADEYESLWLGQDNDPQHFENVRAAFNGDRDPAKLLYLFARCVKNAPRFNARGDFNQSPDRRRRGMRPTRMREQLLGASRLLKGRATVSAVDFREALAGATPDDLVYMDPPYEGVQGRDSRYERQLTREALIEGLLDLNRRRVPFLLSYDGRTGEKTYGLPLPESIARRLELDAGRSSQATLSGRDERTIESLYVFGLEVRTGQELEPEMVLGL